MQTKILIVGAGPTGLTAGLELIRRGVTPRIIDKRDIASTFSRAVGITPRSLELLSHSGVASRLIAEGIAMDGLRVYHGTRLALQMPLHSDRAFFHTILGLPQDRTESIMTDVFTSLGGAVHYGVELESFTQNDAGVEVRFSDGSVDTFDTIIGADGVRSTVREIAGIGYPGIDLEQKWSIADVEIRHWQHAGHLTLAIFEPGTVMVVAPMGGSRYRVVASCENALQAWVLPMDVTHIHREGSFTISVRQAQTYQQGRVFLAGDAAHSHSPVGGRGMNLGIADAAELAKRLVEGGSESYSAQRHQIGEDAIAMTERGRKMTGGRTWPRRTTLRTLLAAANIAGPIKRKIGRFLVEF